MGNARHLCSREYLPHISMTCLLDSVYIREAEPWSICLVGGREFCFVSLAQCRNASGIINSWEISRQDISCRQVPTVFESADVLWE